jgi:hypothetical protein
VYLWRRFTYAFIKVLFVIICVASETCNKTPAETLVTPLGERLDDATKPSKPLRLGTNNDTHAVLPDRNGGDLRMRPAFLGRLSLFRKAC